MSQNALELVAMASFQPIPFQILYIFCPFFSYLPFPFSFATFFLPILIVGKLQPLLLYRSSGPVVNLTYH
jgi:hypothetical protein